MKKEELRIAHHQEEYYKEATIDRLELTVRRLEDKAIELKSRIETIKNPEQIESALNVTELDRVTWFVNDVENLIRNLDINQILTYAIKWGQAAALVEAFAEEKEVE